MRKDERTRVGEHSATLKHEHYSRLDLTFITTLYFAAEFVIEGATCLNQSPSSERTRIIVLFRA
jgi:hypothetical protein